MFSRLRRLTSRGLFNPLSRAAIITWGWNYRHEIFRWGRSLWNELVGRGDIDPARALRVGRVLAAVASEDQLRNAPELRRVTMTGDTVDLDVEPGWRVLPHLIDKVQRVKGVTAVTVNGTAVTRVSSGASTTAAAGREAIDMGANGSSG